MSDSSDSYVPEDEAESNPFEDKHDLPIRIRNTPPPKPEPHPKQSQSQSQSQHVPRPKRPSELKRDARNAERRHLINRYVALYNETVRAIEDGTIYEPEPPHYPYKRLQYGAVTWHRWERDAFYDGLARYGKGGTAQIASLIGTKSELEVRALVGLHEKSLAYRGVKVKQRQLVGRRDVPGAVEVGRECEGAMEESARALRGREEEVEGVLGGKRFGGLYRVDEGVARWVDEQVLNEIEGDGQSVERHEDGKEIAEDNEQRIAKEEETDPEPESDDETTPLIQDSVLFPIARLFNLPKWPVLSERIFMNSTANNLDDNWRTIVSTSPSPDDETTPALTCQALSDFYALALSLTRRLIQSSIFFALSRTRALQRVQPLSDPHVSREDVHAALDVLGLPRDAHEFWATAARRNKLDVWDLRKKKGMSRRDPRHLSHEEVERLLGPRNGRKRLPDDLSGLLGNEAKEKGIAEEGDSDSDDDSDEGDETPAFQFESASDYDDYLATKQDEQQDAAEDARLRQQLGLPPKPAPDDERIVKIEDNDRDIDEEEETLEALPRLSRKLGEMGEWRGRLVFQSEWEHFGTETLGVLEDVGGGGRERERKRRRVE